jgi:hypothetical protein
MVKERTPFITKFILIFEPLLFVFSLFFLAISLKVFLSIFLMGSFLSFLIISLLSFIKNELRVTFWMPFSFTFSFIFLVLFIIVVNL